MNKRLFERNCDLKLVDLEMSRTAIIVVDMINGFVRYGPLSSPRVESIVPNLVNLLNRTGDCEKLFFKDVHSSGSAELKSYPSHCIDGSGECDIIEELFFSCERDNATILAKNSTNGFFADGFAKWIDEINVDNFVVVGCVTDVCLSQFALSLKTYFNQYDMNKAVIVAEDCVQTFDNEFHDGDLLNEVALYNMNMNGIIVVNSLL